MNRGHLLSSGIRQTPQSSLEPLLINFQTQGMKGNENGTDGAIFTVYFMMILNDAKISESNMCIVLILFLFYSNYTTDQVSLSEFSNLLPSIPSPNY